MTKRRALHETSPDEEAARPVIAETLANELHHYLGRWVAVYDDQIVGFGDTATEATASALAAHVTDPLVFRVPAHPERLNLL